MKNDTEEIKILEEFLVNNKDLEELESLISKFNIFEAMNAIRQELRHSDLLSFLLNPNENHGLQNIFLKRLLQKCVMGSDQEDINAIDIDTADYNYVEIKREWKNIDLIILIPSIPMVCAIENKIFSSEHSEQLFRYRDTIEKEYPKYRRLFIYLTPEGIIPSDEDWVPFDYSEVAKLLNGVIETMNSSLGNDIYTLIKHYTAMLERHIITKSPIAELCRKIYKSHTKAIDLILEHRPDFQQEIAEVLENLVRSSKILELDYGPKSYIRFAPKAWDKLKFQKDGNGWTKSNRLLLFEFVNYPDHLTLKLTIGNGAHPERKKIYDLVKKQSKVFKTSPTLSKKFSTIYSNKILKRNDYDDPNKEDVLRKIGLAWEKFLKDDLNKIIDIILNK